MDAYGEPLVNGTTYELAHGMVKEMELQGVNVQFVKLNSGDPEVQNAMQLARKALGAS